MNWYPQRARAWLEIIAMYICEKKKMYQTSSLCRCFSTSTSDGSNATSFISFSPSWCRILGEIYQNKWTGSLNGINLSFLGNLESFLSWCETALWPLWLKWWRSAETKTKQLVRKATLAVHQQFNSRSNLHLWTTEGKRTSILVRCWSTGKHETHSFRVF